MRLLRPMPVAPGVYQLHAIAARVTVLFDDDGVVLVDTGGRGSLGMISAGLKALDSSLESVRLVVLTHYHPDHTGSLANLVDATSAKVAIHSREAAIINGEEPAPIPHRRPLMARLTRPFLGSLYGHPVPVDYSLEDGDSLPTAQEIRVIHTPVHTAGSICLYVASQRMLITGDALRYRSGRLAPPSPGVTLDLQQAKESLNKLLSLDFDIICFSHAPPLRKNGLHALQQLVAKTAS